VFYFHLRSKNCLLDIPNYFHIGVFGSVNKYLPGKWYSADQQCKLRYSVDANACKESVSSWITQLKNVTRKTIILLLRCLLFTDVKLTISLTLHEYSVKYWL